MNFETNLNLKKESLNKRFRKELNNNKNDENNYNSILSEIKYAEFFESLGFEIEYDKRHIYDNDKFLKPDLTLKLNDKVIICEVYRVNAAEKTKIKNRKANLLLDENPLLPQFFQIDHKPQKVFQSEFGYTNEITKKLSKYNLMTRDIPYFLCLDVEALSAYGISDFANRFYGNLLQPLAIKIPNKSDIYGNYSQLGDFYNHYQLSGLIITQNFKNLKRSIIYNPLKNQIIHNIKYKEIKNILDSNLSIINSNNPVQ